MNRWPYPEPDAVETIVRERLGEAAAHTLALAAIGWATVDLVRTARDHPDRTFQPGSPDTLLGAESWISDDLADPVLVLLEPRTEGLLAARLARFDEGPAVLYLRLQRGSFGALPATLKGRGLRLRTGSGPFGPAVLVLDRASRAPLALQLIVLEPGTDTTDAGRNRVPSSA